jgi:hypothetical protein
MVSRTVSFSLLDRFSWVALQKTRDIHTSNGMYQVHGCFARNTVGLDEAGLGAWWSAV